jgi:hypothetical protein
VTVSELLHQLLIPVVRERLAASLRQAERVVGQTAEIGRGTGRAA